MKVHITATPEILESQIKKTVSLLNSVPGVLNFDQTEIWNKAKFSLFDKRLEDIESIPQFSFPDYFHLIESYRTLNDIPEDEFVILVTTIKHDLKWYGSFEGRNIFVYGAGWEHISNADPIFAIAYQCVENIFQTLMGIKVYDLDNEPNIHVESIGCINDSCLGDMEILNKLRTADICQSCLERALKEGVDPDIINQICDINERIRLEFINKKRISNDIKLKKVHIDADANIKIGDEVFKSSMGIMPKLIFIYFLKFSQGVDTKSLSNEKEQGRFLNLYKLIKNDKNYNKYKEKEDITIIQRLCCNDREHNTRSTFTIYKSRLNADLKNLLGEELASHYQINSIKLEGRNYLYKINLNHDYLDIDPRF